MQVSTNLFYDRTATRLSGLTSTAAQLNTQISTGKKYTSPSQNVAVAQQVAEYDRKDADADVYGKNLTLAGSLLGQTDTTLSSITDQLTRAKELATSAANDVLSDSQRKAIGAELSTVVATLISLGNTKDMNGQPLFGTRSGNAAVIDNGNGTFSYSGTNAGGAADSSGNLANIVVGDGLTIQATETAGRVFQSSAGDTLANLSALAKALQDGTGGATTARNALDSITTASDQVTMVQASVGARAARVDLQQNLLTSANADRAEQRSSLEDTDVSQTYMELQKTMTILSATQASFSKLSQLSLFEYLR